MNAITKSRRFSALPIAALALVAMIAPSCSTTSDVEAGTGGGGGDNRGVGGAGAGGAGGGGVEDAAAPGRDVDTGVDDASRPSSAVDASLDASSEADAVADAHEAGPGIQGASAFHGVNWADPRDNYVNGLLEPSGLSSGSDSYATVSAKAGDILSEFQSKLGADTIRIPINEPTVAGAWWSAYRGIIDVAVQKGMKVMVAYWAYQNGKPADAGAFKNMWQTVVARYLDQDLVYFDIHNEPYGYGSGWNDAAAQWLADFTSVPRGRVIVAGTGYDDDVTPVGADKRFDGCLLELHIYGFWHQDWTTKKQWTDNMTSRLGSYGKRTIVGEWGAPMTDGIDYGDASDGNVWRDYVNAVADLMRNIGTGSVYWPGLRSTDGYSMTTLHQSGSTSTLSINSTSGLDRLRWSWGL